MEDASRSVLEATWTDGAVAEGENRGTTNSKNLVREHVVKSAMVMVTTNGVVRENENKQAVANKEIANKLLANKEIVNKNLLANKEIANKVVVQAIKKLPTHKPTINQVVVNKMVVQANNKLLANNFNGNEPLGKQEVLEEFVEVECLDTFADQTCEYTHYICLHATQF